LPSAARQPVPPRAVASSALRAVVEDLRVSPHAPELEASPALVGRLRETPRSYFRFVGRRFTRAVCARFRGLFTPHGRTLWVHGWTDDYMELSIDSWLTSPQDMRQVAYDVGIQLGWAHPRAVAGKDFPPGLRGILLEATCKNEGRIRKTIDDLTEGTLAAWRAFREATAPQPSSRAFR